MFEEKNGECAQCLFIRETMCNCINQTKLMSVYENKWNKYSFIEKLTEYLAFLTNNEPLKIFPHASLITLKIDFKKAL